MSYEEYWVLGNGNDAKSLTRELQALIPDLVKATGASPVRITIEIDEDVAPRLSYPGSLSLKLKSEIWEAPALADIGYRLTPYAELRAMGHSIGYTQFCLSHLGEPLPPEILARFPLLGKFRKEIALPWLRTDIEQTIAYGPTKSQNGWVCCSIVDGDLAWAYRPDANTNRDGARLCFDASELHPATRPAFEAVYRQWLVEKQTRRKNKSWRGDIWSFHEVVLKDRYKILWRSPAKLNPQMIFD